MIMLLILYCYISVTSVLQFVILAKAIHSQIESCLVNVSNHHLSQPSGKRVESPPTDCLHYSILKHNSVEHPHRMRIENRYCSVVLLLSFTC